MPLSEFQNEIVGSCEDCKSTVYFNQDDGKLIFTCPCGVIDPNHLPDWVRAEIE